jgi:1,4-dihydroxy-2-naphthoyl-CoA hydrolase
LEFPPPVEGTLIEKIGLEWVEVTPERIVARIPVESNVQPYGLLHGGATAALCETIGSLGAALVSGPESLPVGIELNVNHIRSVREGFVTGTGVPLHSGRRTAVWDMRVHDDDGRLVAVGRLTLALSSPASQG